MQVRRTLFQIALFLCGTLLGCAVNHGSLDIQPYAPIAEEDVPGSALKAFRAKHPAVTIEQVERRPWPPPLTGGDHYQFTFEENGEKHQAAFRENGTELRRK